MSHVLVHESSTLRWLVKNQMHKVGYALGKSIWEDGVLGCRRSLLTCGLFFLTDFATSCVQAGEWQDANTILLHLIDHRQCENAAMRRIWLDLYKKTVLYLLDSGMQLLSRPEKLATAILSTVPPTSDRNSCNKDKNKNKKNNNPPPPPKESSRPAMAAVFVVRPGHSVVHLMQTVSSFLQCCADDPQIDIQHWVCCIPVSGFAAWTSSESSVAVRKRFPFWTVFTTYKDTRNVEIPQHVQTDWYLYCETGWHFFQPKHFVTEAFAILALVPDVAKLIFNRECIETIADLDPKTDDVQCWQHRQNLNYLYAMDQIRVDDNSLSHHYTATYDREQHRLVVNANKTRTHKQQLANKSPQICRRNPTAGSYVAFFPSVYCCRL